MPSTSPLREIREWEDFEVSTIWSRPKAANIRRSCSILSLRCQILCANMVLGKKRKPQITQLRWGSMTMQDYGDLAAAMKSEITRFRNLPMEVVFLAQERTSHDESSDETLIVPEVGPALTPSVAGHLNASVSVIASTFIKRRKKKQGKGEIIVPVYSMRIGPNPVYTTKVRKPMSIVLPNSIDDPTYTDVVSEIEGK